MRKIKNVISCHHQHHYKCKIVSNLCVSWDGGNKAQEYEDIWTRRVIIIILGNQHHHQFQYHHLSKILVLRRGGPSKGDDDIYI